MAWAAYAAGGAWQHEVMAYHLAQVNIRRLRAHGPTPAAFTLREHFPPPGPADARPRLAPGDWMCPA